MLSQMELGLAEHGMGDVEYLQYFPVWLKFWFHDHQC